jgi:hypothetical protein
MLYDAAGMARGRDDGHSQARTPERVDDARCATTTVTEGTGFGATSASLGSDRAVTAINRWDRTSPWRFNVHARVGDQRLPLAGAVFTGAASIDRESVSTPRRSSRRRSARCVCPAGDSIKWIFHDRDDGVLRERTMTASAFGTADQSVLLPTTAAVGVYVVDIQAKRQGKWRSVARTTYRVAEYRPPEFLVELNAENAPRMPGDRFGATIQARYLFGAPMARADVRWIARQAPVSPWELDAAVEDWYRRDQRVVGGRGERRRAASGRTSGEDTLDARGERRFPFRFPERQRVDARVTLDVGVTDVNRQAVGASRSAIVHRRRSTSRRSRRAQTTSGQRGRGR